MRGIFARFHDPLVPPLTLMLLVAVFALTPRAGADPLTLQEGLSVVTSYGYDMRVAMAQQSAAERGEGQARARHLPQVTVYADQTWLKNQPEAIFPGGTAPLGGDESLRYGITVRQLVTDFGRTGSSVAAAQASARGQSLETWRTRNTVALDFVIAYVSLLQAEKTLILADQEVQRLEAHLQDSQALYDAGEVTLNDVLAAEVMLADAALRRITNRDERNLAVSRLNYLMLRPLDSSTSAVDFPFQMGSIPELEDLWERAGVNRPELKIIAERISAKEAMLSSKEAEALPDLYVSGAYTYEENPYRVYEDNLSATIGLTWDLYDGGAKPAARKQITDELTALVARGEQTRELINLEVKDAHRLLTGAVEKTGVTLQAVNQARESLRLQRSRYAEGEVTATEVTDTVTSLARAENNHWAAVHERLKAEARLFYATGEDLAQLYSPSSVEIPHDPPDEIPGEEK